MSAIASIISSNIPFLLNHRASVIGDGGRALWGLLTEGPDQFLESGALTKGLKAAVAGDAPDGDQSAVSKLGECFSGFLRAFVSFIPGVNLLFAGRDGVNVCRNLYQFFTGQGVANLWEAGVAAFGLCSLLVPGGKVALSLVSAPAKKLIAREAFAKTFFNSSSCVKLLKGYRSSHNISNSVPDKDVYAAAMKSAYFRRQIRKSSQRNGYNFKQALINNRIRATEDYKPVITQVVPQAWTNFANAAKNAKSKLSAMASDIPSTFPYPSRAMSMA